MHFPARRRSTAHCAATIVLLFTAWTCSAQYYWVGGSGNWSDPSHWATTSGGSTFHVAPPTSDDDVFFDANSFSQTGQKVTMDLPIGNCRSMDWTGVTNNPGFENFAPTILNIHGSLTLSPDMTCNLRFIELEGDVGTTTITTNGTSLGSNSILRLFGTSTYELMDVLNVNSMQIHNGTFNSNNNTINCEFAITLDTGNPITINMGTSVLNIQQWRNRATNVTLNMAECTINTQSMYADESNSTQYSYGDLVIESGGLIYGSAIYKSITLVSIGGTERVTIQSGITLNVGEFSADGSRQGPLELITDVEGQQAFINKATGEVNCSYLVMRDIWATGNAVFNAVETDDLGNNNGWNISPPVASDYYWVGNSGNWSDLNHWATSSGGNTLHTLLPSQYDNVIFDENSVTEENVTIEIDDDFSVFDINCSGLRFEPTINADFENELSVYGSVNFPDSVRATIYNIDLDGRRGGNTISIGSLSQVNNLAFWGGGEWTFISDIECSSVSFVRGTLNTNGFDVTCLFNFRQRNFDAPTLRLGDSRITCRTFSIQDPETDFDPGTSNIICSSNFDGMGFSYFEVTLTGDCTVEGANTYEFLTAEPGASVSFQADSIQTINQGLDLAGTPENPISMSSTIDGTRATLSKASGTVNGVYLLLKDMNATGGAVFNASQSVDNGNNSGWNITEITPLNFYWVGDGGNWSDFANHWATSSGGNTFHASAPRTIDDVFFDASSFSSDDQEVVVDVAEANFNNMSWKGVTNEPVFRGRDATLNIYGSLLFSDGMRTDVGNFNFLGEGEADIDPGYPGSPGNNTVMNFNGGGVWNLLDTLTTREFNLEGGTFNTNDNGIHADFQLTFSGQDAKVLDLGKSRVFARLFTWKGIDGENLTLLGGESHITCSSQFLPRPQIASNPENIIIELNNLRFIDNGLDVGTIFGEVTLDTLTIDPGKDIEFTAGVAVEVNQLIARGTQDDFIYMFSSSEGIQALISQSEGVVDGEFLELMDIGATGGATFNARSSVDLGNVSGWTFFRQAQTIDFPSIEDRLETDGTFNITATASSGLDVDLEVIAGPAELDGSTVTLTGAGEVRIRATQEGDIRFEPAPSVINSFCSNPVRPDITVSDTNEMLLISSRADGNQWYSDGNPVEGATGQTHLATHSASYTVQVSVGSCSSEVSDALDITTTGLNDWLDNAEVSVWPNPFGSRVNIASTKDLRDLRYQLRSIHGQVLRQGRIDLNKGDVLSVEITDLTPGVYLLTGTSKDGDFRRRLISTQ